MSLPITLYTTASREKELFVPIDPSLVRIYTCGPTVYGDPHIGNMRAYVFADVLRQTLQHIWWYTLQHITNITDVGHLTDDGDQGEDKMEKWARKTWKTVWEVARMYEENFMRYSDALRVQRFDEYARATEHINEQIHMVKQLIDKWYTYVIGGDWIYMDTSKVEEYGKIAQLDIEWMRSHHRTEWDKIDSSKKKQITDFALWKFSPHDEVRAMEWIFDGERSGALIVQDLTVNWSSEKSGEFALRQALNKQEISTKWFPGRHIECSAMAVKYLWETFDIHTWGIDHVPVHHTNEIAQAECALWCDKRVNYWMHCQFLQIDGAKVSKSKGDDLSIPGILEQWYDPLDLRYFYMTGHYRSFLDFSRAALEAAKMSRKNMIKKIASVEWTVDGVTHWGIYTKLAQALADDLDTVRTLSIIHKTLADASPQDITDILMIDDHILKLWLRAGVTAYHALQDTAITIPEHIQQLAEQRAQAKKEKNYVAADRLRDVLAEAWRVAKDTHDGYTLERLSS